MSNNFRSRVMEVVGGELQDIRRLMLDSPDKHCDLTPILDQMGACCLKIDQIRDGIAQVHKALDVLRNPVPDSGNSGTDEGVGSDGYEDPVTKAIRDYVTDTFDPLEDEVSFRQRVTKFASDLLLGTLATPLEVAKRVAPAVRLWRDMQAIRSIRAMKDALDRLNGAMYREIGQLKKQLSTGLSEVSSKILEDLQQVSSTILEQLQVETNTLADHVDKTREEILDRISTDFTTLHNYLSDELGKLSYGHESILSAIELCCHRLNTKLDTLLARTSTLDEQRNTNASFETKLKAILSELAGIRRSLQEAENNSIGGGGFQFSLPGFQS